jgi:hypothetical protein
MSSIPPKHSPDVPSADEDAPETGGGLVAMYNAASHASAESFPVLKAFQDYIEAERSQARKRVMLLSVFFAVLMGVVVTGFLTAGIFMLRNMSNVQTKLLDVALAQRTAPAPAPAPAPAIQTSPLLEESVRQMSRVTTELQASLDKKLDGVSEIASQVNEKVASQNSELEKLRTELKQMQEQSVKLKNELVSVQKEVSKKPEPAKAKPTGRPAPAAVAAAPAPQQTAPAAAPAVVSAPSVAVAPAALAVAAPAAPSAPAPKPEARDSRFPPAVKDPPVAPSGVTPPSAPKGMLAIAIPLQTKNVGTIPWRVLIPE